MTCCSTGASLCPTAGGGRSLNGWRTDNSSSLVRTAFSSAMARVLRHDSPGDGGGRLGPVFAVSWDELIPEGERRQGMRAALLYFAAPLFFHAQPLVLEPGGRGCH